MTNIVDIGVPHSAPSDESFFSVMSAEGKLKIFNYTVIESQQAYIKHIKEAFGVKQTTLNNASRRIEDTSSGMRMIDQGFPLKFTAPL